MALSASILDHFLTIPVRQLSLSLLTALALWTALALNRSGTDSAE